MSWVDDRLVASINGLRFFVRSSDMPFGRRVIASEFPYRNNAWVDDLGAEHRVLRVQGFLVEGETDAESLATQRAKIFAELNKSGTVKLVHPRLGEMVVQPGPCRWSTSGGVENLSLVFHPPSDQAQPTYRIDTQKRVDAAVDACNTAAAKTLTDELEVEGSLLSRAQAVVDNGLDALREVNGRLSSAIAPVSDIAQSIDDIADQTGALLLQPSNLINAVVDVVTSVYGTLTSVQNAMTAYRGIGDTLNALSPVAGSTPTRLQEQKNQTALNNSMQAIATVEVVRQISEQSRVANATGDQSPFTSYDEAVAVRNELIDQIDLLSETADQGLYNALVQLRVDFSTHLNTHGVQLPRISRVSYTHPLPLLVISHIIYGDVEHVDDLIARNAIAQPIFIAAGTSLEILTNAA